MFKKLLLTLSMLAVLCVGTITVLAANTPVSISLTVVNQVTGDTPSSEKTFTYRLTPVDTSNPMPSATTVTENGSVYAEISISGSGSKSFGVMTYDAPGVYQYTVDEMDTSATNYTIDTTVYDVFVYITTDADGVLSAMVNVYEQGSSYKSSAILFQNEYNDPTVVPTATEEPEEEPEPTPTPTMTPRPLTAATATPAMTAMPTITSTATAVPVPVAAVTPVPEDAAESVPLEDTSGLLTTLQDFIAPLAGLLSTGEAWALLNLLLCIATVAMSLILLVGYFYKRKAEQDDEAEDAPTAEEAALAEAYGEGDAQQKKREQRKRKNKGFARVFSILPAVFGVILFILTEDMTTPMIIIDRWTLAMVLIFLVQVFVAIQSRKKDEEVEEKTEGD